MDRRFLYDPLFFSSTASITAHSTAATDMTAADTILSITFCGIVSPEHLAAEQPYDRFKQLLYKLQHCFQHTYTSFSSELFVPSGV